MLLEIDLLGQGGPSGKERLIGSSDLAALG